MTHTKDEALQMCLEYIETDAHKRKYVRHAIKQALAAPVQEPVAWMTQARNFVHVMEFTEAEAKLYGWIPVYTTPPAAQPAVQEPLMVDIHPPATQRDRWMYDQGRLAERDPRSHPTPPAQPAVPLTDEQIRATALSLRNDFTWEEFARAIEAAHGITKGQP
jgi:hypothetical protein